MSDETVKAVDNGWRTRINWDQDFASLDASVEFCGSIRESNPSVIDALERLSELVAWALEKARGPKTAVPQSPTPERAILPDPSAVQAAAQRTLDLMPKPKPGDPSGDVILTIVVVMTIIKLLVIAYNCWKDHHKTVSIVYNPSLIQRLYLRRVVRRVLKEHGQLGKLDDVMTALLKMAKASTQEDIQAIFDEARSDPAIWTTATQLGLL